MAESETSYDPDLPGRIRGEMGAGLPEERLPGPPPSRGRIVLSGVVLGLVFIGITLWQHWPRRRGDAPPPAPAPRLSPEAALALDRLKEAEQAADWLKAYDAALVADRLLPEEDPLKAGIAARLARARTEVLAAQKLVEARELKEQGKTAEVVAALEKVPDATAAAEAARAEAEAARAKLLAKAMTDAGTAADAGRWNEARAVLDAAPAPTAADPVFEALSRRIARGRAQAEALAGAEALLGALRLDDAEKALEQVDPKGPSAAGRRDLADRLAAARLLSRRIAEAKTWFDQGQGEKALDVLGQPGPALPSWVREPIAATVAVYQRVMDELDRGRPLEALESARALAALPLPPGNWYRLKTEEARPALERKAVALAEGWVAEGVGAFRDRRYAPAREAFAKALRAVPDHAVAAFYLRDRLPQTGRDLYRDGYVLKALDPEAARRRFEEALGCLAPEDPFAEKARKALK